MKQQIIKLLLRYRIVLIILVFGGLMAYGLLRLQLISNPEADPNYINSNESAIQTSNIRVKDSLQEEIDKLADTPVNVQPDTLGRPDPFNP